MIVRIKKDRDGAVRELIAVQNHFKKENEHFKFLTSFYGSPSNTLNKTIAWYLDTNQLAHPVKTLYEINKAFMERKLVTPGDAANTGLYYELEGVFKGLQIMFGIKKKEDFKENEKEDLGKF